MKATQVRHQGDRMRFVIIKSSICSVCHSTFSLETKSFLLVLFPLLFWTRGNWEWVICQDEAHFREDGLTVILLEIFMLVAQQDGFYPAGPLCILYVCMCVYVYVYMCIYAVSVFVYNSLLVGMAEKKNSLNSWKGNLTLIIGPFKGCTPRLRVSKSLGWCPDL